MNGPGHRTLRDRGEGAVSYGAVLLLVAGMVTVLASTGIADTVGGGVRDAICRIARQDDCGGRPAAGGPVADRRPAEPAPRIRPYRQQQENGDEDDLGLVPLGDLDESDLVDVDNCRSPFGGDLCMSGDVTFSTQVSGIIVFLYELCDEDMACVRREATAILGSLEEQFPDLNTDQLLDALEEEELPEKIEEVRDEGGCLNLRIETTWLGAGDPRLRWRHRSPGSGDDCFRGAALRLADARRASERTYEVTAGRDGVEVTLKVTTSDLLRAGYGVSGGNIRRLLDLIESQGGQAIPSEGLAGRLWDEAVRSENHEDLAAAIEAGQNGDSCLTVEVSPSEGGDLEVEWSTVRRGRGRC